MRRLIAPPPSRVVERDSVRLRLGENEIEVMRVRNPRAKRIKLSVDERGARLTLPPRVSLAAGELFLHQHRDWLAQQLQRYLHADVLPCLRRGESGWLPLRGQSLPLHWHVSRYARLEVDALGAHLHLPVRASEPLLRRVIKDFYEAQARADVGRWLPQYLPSLPRVPRAVRYKVMSSQWGSLAPDTTMALDLALVLGRPEAFEYVLVHELCHLIQANHSPAFWHEVQQRCPDWRQQRDYFQQQGRQLKAQLRALLLPANEPVSADGRTNCE